MTVRLVGGAVLLTTFTLITPDIGAPSVGSVSSMSPTPLLSTGPILLSHSFVEEFGS